MDRKDWKIAGLTACALVLGGIAVGSLAQAQQRQPALAVSFDGQPAADEVCMQDAIRMLVLQASSRDAGWVREQREKEWRALADRVQAGARIVICTGPGYTQ